MVNLLLAGYPIFGHILYNEPMSGMLLKTKFAIPPSRLRLVPRPRLITELDAGRTAKVILLSAPAGFGKTTLLSSWIKMNDFPAAWLSLDADDNDPFQLMTYFITALQSLAPSVGHSALTLMNATTPDPIESVLITLINDLADLPKDLYLFLDDYHVIDTQEIHSAVEYFVDKMPPAIHLIISSRSDPPLALSRLRVRGQLIEVRQADLRFTTAEADAFFSQTARLNLSETDVVALESRTEGWIAGLQLAALSLRGKKDIHAFLQEFGGSHRYVIDFLADEVLSQQTAAVRDFLLQTAVLDRISGSLADHVTGRDDSAALLAQLEEDNLFLIALDEHREWYRFHHLFRDFLRFQLDQELERQLHIRAADWFFLHKLYAEAVKHALASSDIVKAEQIISQAAPVAFNQGALTTMHSWLDSLPSEVIFENCELAILKGFALFFSAAYEMALPYVAVAERISSSQRTGSNYGQFLSLKAHVALWEEQVDVCIDSAREALDYLSENDLSFRNLTYNVLGQAFEIKGDVAGATEVYRQAFHSGWQSGDRLGALVVFANLIFSLNELGRRTEAAKLCEQLASQSAELSIPGLPLLPAIYLPWSLIAFEANQLEMAQELITQALELVTKINVSQGITWGHYILAQIELAQAEFEVALENIRRGLELAVKMGRESPHYAWFAALEAQLYLQQGSLVEPIRWATTMSYSAQDTPRHWLEYPYFTYVRLLLAQERFREAQLLLGNMVSTAQNGGRNRKVITCHLLLARTFLSLNDRPQALSHLSQAVQIAGSENYRRAFLVEGSLIADLLPEIGATDPAFVDALLADFGSTGPTPSVPGQPVESLSERELEVLQLVANGLSNREIAKVLFISLGTVKKHLNNIFGKLAVKSRTQAVARAGELGLLE